MATLLLFIIRPGSGLHPPQCQWDLYQDIERLKCNVDPGNTLIVEEEVHGVSLELTLILPGYVLIYYPIISGDRLLASGAFL